MDSLKYLPTIKILPLKHTIRDWGLTIQASARLQRLSRCGGTTTSQKAGKPITPSIHWRSICRTFCSGTHSAVISSKVVAPDFNSLFVFLRWFASAPGANPKRRHVVTRRDHCLSTPLLPCPYPISPLTFATTEVSSKQITKNATDSLCVNTPRGIIPVS